jgi:hypothetical protein
VHAADLGGSDMSEAEKALLKRAVTLMCALDKYDERLAMAGDVGPKQLLEYQRASNTLRRLLSALGLRRRAKDVTPDIDTYLASRGRRRGTTVEATE